MSEFGSRNDGGNRDGRRRSHVDSEPETERLVTDGGQPAVEKNPMLAAVLSFVIPGVGQFYAGRGTRAAVMLLGWIAWQVVAVLLTAITFGIFLPVWLLVELVIHVGVAYDAHKQAQSYNAGTDPKQTTQSSTGASDRGSQSADSSGRSETTSGSDTRAGTGTGAKREGSTSSVTQSSNGERMAGSTGGQPGSSATRSGASAGSRSGSSPTRSGASARADESAGSPGTGHREEASDPSDENDNTDSSGLDWNDL